MSLQEPTESNAGAPTRRKAIHRPLPQEGDQGLYSQTWFPLCLSSDVAVNQVVTRPFLGGKVAVFRAGDGVARVVSAYCLHLGADLGLGKVVGNNLQCSFHKWEYDREGRCVKTGCGDPAPKDAFLFRFPTRERWGLIWAFNGEEAAWELPDFRYPDDQLHIETSVLFPCTIDPWVVMCNTPDTQHIELLHGLKINPVGLADFKWTDHGFRYPLSGTHWMNRPFEWTLAIYGTNIFFQEGPIGGRYFGFIAPMSLDRPKQSMLYSIIAVPKGDGSQEELECARRWAREAQMLEMDFASQDADIFLRSRFRHGILTARDKPLARFMDYLRTYPRANPAVEFIT